MTSENVPLAVKPGSALISKLNSAKCPVGVFGLQIH